MELTFQSKDYELFFSNNLEPLRALNYADERFFDEFERLSGARYRILSIIRSGWQEKYGLKSDIENLKKYFEQKLVSRKWIDDVLKEYEVKKEGLTKTLQQDYATNYKTSGSKKLGEALVEVRKLSAPLDAMSNMLHLFSSLVGGDFMSRLRVYSKSSEAVHKNFLFYTQPIRESRYAKVRIHEFAEKFALKTEDEILSNILRVGAYVKDDVSALLEERGNKLTEVFLEISKRLSVSPDDLNYLTLNEITSHLDKGEPVSEDLIRSRRMLTILIYPETTLAIYEGEKAETFLWEGNPTSKAPKTFSSKLRGQVASLGKATGRAVVVKNSDEAMELVQEGDILVAPYTAPEYLPAMKKAAAIITETGGITSHAAIVSRELNIPCVIGVAGATTVLRTGDMIEVNADEGVVAPI